MSEYTDATWTPSTGGTETVLGVVVYDAGDPEAGPEFRLDATTGEMELTAGPNDTVVMFPGGAFKPGEHFTLEPGEVTITLGEDQP